MTRRPAYKGKRLLYATLPILSFAVGVSGVASPASLLTFRRNELMRGIWSQWATLKLERSRLEPSGGSCGQAHGWSTVSSFVTPPLTGPLSTVSFFAIADMGQVPQVPCAADALRQLPCAVVRAHNLPYQIPSPSICAGCTASMQCPQQGTPFSCVSRYFAALRCCG